MKTLQLNVFRYYTDMNGVIQAPNTVPIALQNKLPVWMFNKFDKQSGYKIAQLLTPPPQGVYFLYAYTKGMYNFLDYQIGNNVNQLIQFGDHILVFGDDPILPNYLAMIVLHCDVVSYDGFINAFDDKPMQLIDMQYITDNEGNWLETVHNHQTDIFGVYKDDQYNPYASRDPQQFIPGNLKMLLNIGITSKIGLLTYYQFATNSLQFNFNFATSNSNTNGKNGKIPSLYRVG